MKNLFPIRLNRGAPAARVRFDAPSRRTFGARDRANDSPESDLPADEASAGTRKGACAPKTRNFSEL